ncbi:O-antigen ligase family protein [Flavicella sp.]|uniref:O-antigen ligase family protein n=1 Tax=Flavicella sp. TaxID=2957742 RepID=UPI0030194472
MILIILYGCKLVLSKEYFFSFSKIDVLLLVFILYISINRYYIQSTYGFSIRYMELLGLCVVYIVLRRFTFLNYCWLLLAIVISGILQAVYGNLQLLGYYSSNHSGFKMTGSFFNPGPYAGFLAVVWPLALGMYLFKESIFNLIKTNTSEFRNVVVVKLFEYIPLIGIIAISLVLPASLSRASWLAVILSTCLLLELRYGFLKKKSIGFYERNKKILFAFIFLILVFSLIGLYSMKKDSSTGRLLIWKVTSEMISEHVWLGVGFDNFKTHYMNYQARHFENKSTENFGMMNADNTNYAFNEFLQFFAENGLLGIVLLFIIVFFLWKQKPSLENQCLASILKSSMIAIGVFSLFSYPSQILPVKLNLVLLLAMLAGVGNKANLKGVLNYKIKNVYLKTSLGILTVVCCVFMIKQTYKLHIGYRQWNTAMQFYMQSEYNTSISHFNNAFAVFNKNGTFLMNYGKTLSMNKEHKKAIEVLEEAKLYLNNTVIEVALGDSYKVLNNSAKAEVAYTSASNMIPSKFYPNYLLAKLYIKNKQYTKALVKAKELMQKQVKINSTAIDEIKHEMLQIIKEHDKTSGLY